MDMLSIDCIEVNQVAEDSLSILLTATEESGKFYSVETKGKMERP